MHPETNQRSTHETAIIDPYFVISAKCSSACPELHTAAMKALFDARAYLGLQLIVVESRHHKLLSERFDVYVDGPGIIVGRGTVDTIMQRTYDNGAVRKEWTELFPARAQW